jgi:hypothetical protein
MAFKFKTKEEFLDLDWDKRIYYLSRLYMKRDRSNSHIPFKARLFSCINYLRKQDVHSLSVLYNYLTDLEDGHNGERIWNLLPRAVLHDQELRRKIQTRQVYEDFDKTMLQDILKGDE